MAESVFQRPKQENGVAMFNGNFRHPLDNLIRDDRLFMLEAILPFLSDRMKAPLAMYIKIMELQTILSSLQDKECMTRCGLHKDINNQEDILSSLADCGFADVKGQFANMKKMMDMMKMMESTKEMSGENFSGNSNMFSDLFGGYAGAGSSDRTEASESAGSPATSEASESVGSPFASESSKAARSYKGSEFSEDSTDSLYQHYSSVNTYETDVSPQAERFSQTEHFSRMTDDLYGSIKDLFDAYDQEHL